MKKFTLFISLLFTIVSLSAQDYLISFAGTGASTTVGTVNVENLTQGKSITINGTEVLHLVATSTGLNPMSEFEKTLRIYPNPTTGNCTIEFVATASGIVTIELFDITGKRLCTAQNKLTIGTHSYQVSGLWSGIYTARINAQAYSYTGKLVSNGAPNSDVKISYIGNSVFPVTAKMLKSASTEKTMQYTTGDRLKYNGISGSYSTITTNIPTQSETIYFTFIACTDADGNNYPVVQIGTQTWMAENLRTTKYRNGDPITQITAAGDWISTITGACCNYDNNTENVNYLGRLYNWNAVNDSRSIAPEGWHVASYDEWVVMAKSLKDDKAVGGKLKETGLTNWKSPNTGASNSTGFTGVPGGDRSIDGKFYDIGYLGYWWTSSVYDSNNSYIFQLRNDQDSLKLYSGKMKAGFSVRCIKDENSLDEGDWKTSDFKTYQIPSAPNSTITDNLSKFTFIFPQGGEGELTVRSISSGPNEINKNDSVFKIEFKENIVVQIVFENNPSYYNSLIGYFKYENMSWHDEKENGWLPLPDTSIGTKTYYELPGSSLNKSAQSNPLGFEIYKNVKIPKNAKYDELFKLYTEQIVTVGNMVYNNLPATLKEKFKNDFEKDAPPKLYVGMNKEAYFKSFKTNDKYLPFMDIFTKVLPCRFIMLNDASNINNIAHETGHYIHHILVGNSKYREFANNYRGAGHVVGSLGAKKQLIEEPAFFTEYFMTGKVGLAGKPENGSFVATGKLPEEVDFTDKEGFGVTILASLTRHDDKIIDFTGRPVTVPVLSPEITDRSVFFGEAYEIIAQGDDDIYALREKVENVLTKYNQKEKMPAMMEPLGWSYHGKGRIAINNKGVKDVTIRSISKVGDVTYRTKLSEPTDTTGIFMLDRIFPGKSSLRIYLGKDSIDIDNISISWTEPTNKEIQLGNFSPTTSLAGTEWRKIYSMSTRSIVFTENTFILYVGYDDNYHYMNSMNGTYFLNGNTVTFTPLPDRGSSIGTINGNTLTWGYVDYEKVK